MSIVKFINVYNDDPEVTVEMHNYLSDDLKTDSGKYINGLGFITENYLDEFNAVKVASQKTCGNQFKQITISLSPAGNSCSDEEYMQIGMEIAQPLYDKGFQVLIYLHKDTDTRHLHLMMNTVSFITGKMFTQSKRELNRYKLHCNHVFTNHKLDPIRKATEAMLDTEMHNISEGFDFLEIFDEIMADKASSLSDLFDDTSDYSSYSCTPNMNEYRTYEPAQARNYFNPDAPKPRTNIVYSPDVALLHKVLNIHGREAHRTRGDTSSASYAIGRFNCPDLVRRHEYKPVVLFDYRIIEGVKRGSHHRPAHNHLARRFLKASAKFGYIGYQCAYWHHYIFGLRYCRAVYGNPLGD